MKLANCHRCGTKGKTTRNGFTGDSHFAYCPKCRFRDEAVFVAEVTRYEAVKEWNKWNREANNANNDK